MDELLANVDLLLGYMEANAGNLSVAVQQELAQFLQEVSGFIEEQNRPVDVPIPPGADLLWILAGGQEDAFISYLRTYPDAGLNALLSSPQQLRQVIDQLTRTMPQGRGEVKDGIEQAALQSSNIFGFQFDPKNGTLLVRFQNGGIYAYAGVPQGVFKVFQQGAVPAKTQGKNKFGQWYVGKLPSLGAAFYELIRNGGYPYKKLQ